jgi:hypothetical protein
MIPITTFCIVMLAEGQAQILLAKPNLSLEKSLNVKVLFIIIKLSLKHEKCFNVVSEKTHSSTKNLLPHSGH